MVVRVVVVRAAAVVASRHVVVKAVRRSHRANLRVVTTRPNPPVKIRGAVVKASLQGKGSADAARANLRTRSNLEARL